MFFVGQPVVCIASFSAEWRIRWPELALPTKGTIYRVRDVYYEDWAGLRLQGIKNPPSDYGVEPYYTAEAFRPLTERKNDAEAFVRKLKEACAPKQKEKERVGVE